MNRTLIAIFGTLTALCPAPTTAQWLKYPTAGVPRQADGKPSLDAVTPRTADGKPDLSGLWEAAPRKGSLMEDIAKDVGAPLPLKPAGAEMLKSRLANEDKDDPDGYCQPLGLVRMHIHPYPRKIVQAPGLMLILFERDNIFRQIFTDGRPLPADRQPAFYGYSIGKWEGDTLVVTTTGFKDGMWLDNVGNPFTDAATVTERYRRPNFGRLEIDVTIDDPGAYSKPWTVKLQQNIALDTDLLEFFCTENNKDMPHMVGK